MRKEEMVEVLLMHIKERADKMTVSQLKDLMSRNGISKSKKRS